jgi:hypothetical protein
MCSSYSSARRFVVILPISTVTSGTGGFMPLRRHSSKGTDTFLKRDIADVAMGIAFASTLAPDESFTTVELKINFFRPVWQARLKAEGMVVRRGHTIGYVERTITDEENRLIAKAASTCMALRGQKAEGR